MRELKFRVWDTSQEDWLHDCMLKETVFGCTSGYKHNSERGFAELHQNQDHLEYIIEQYTGLKDKYGKEIYEGDIVEKCYNKAKKLYSSAPVEFKHGRFESGGWTLCKFAHKCEVIGNIHENKE